MLKHFEILSRVLQLYCNVVVHNQAETKRDDWTDRKQTFQWTTIPHTCPRKQAGVDCCCRPCSNANPDCNASSWFFGRIPKHSDTYGVDMFFNSSPQTRLTDIKELVNSCEFSKTWDCKQMYRHRLTEKQMDTKKKENLNYQHCCQCWSPRYWISVLSTRCGGYHPKGFIVAS